MREKEIEKKVIITAEMEEELSNGFDPNEGKPKSAAEEDGE